MKKVLMGCVPFIMTACSGTRPAHKGMPSYSHAIADSMLAYALDHEGLYSLADTIKPISSVKFLSFPIAKDSTHAATDFNIAKNKAALDTIAMYQQICKQLSNDRVKLVIIPFERPEEGNRHLEIYAVNMHQFRSKIKEHQSFFGQFGITPLSDPAQVITLIEYEKKYDRWRGYGYLFGYPSYAVDFFVQAGQQQDSTKQFVKRQFFHIPVYAATEGYFTYALPQNQPPTAEDSMLYQTAGKLLDRYKKLRNRFLTPKGLKAVKLWQSVSNK